MNLVFVARVAHGRGLFALKEISSGSVILRLRGPRISYQQVLRLRNPDNAFQIESNRYINLRKPEVIGNHSCQPNSGVTPELKVVALKRIKIGEEICYDYSACMDRDSECDFVCRCGYKQCRGIIKGFETLPARTQARYIKLGIVQPFLLD